MVSFIVVVVPKLKEECDCDGSVLVLLLMATTAVSVWEAMTDEMAGSF